MKQLQAVLKQTSLGQDLSEDELNQLLEVGTVFDVLENSILLQEGEQSHSLVILLEGEAEVTKIKLDQTKIHRIGVCGQGSVLGEIGLLLNVPNTATVRTLQPTKVFSCSYEAFRELLSDGKSFSSKLALKLARILASRLQNITNEFVYLLQERDRWQKIGRFQQNRMGLVKQVEELKSENLLLQKQLQQFNTKKQQNAIFRKGLQFTFTIAGSLSVVLLLVTFWMRSDVFATRSATERATKTNTIQKENSAPVLIPYIQTKEKCDARKSITIWIEERQECYDLDHSRNT